MPYALQEPATGKLTEAELDASIEPWHLPHYIRQCEMERKQHDAAATPADGAHAVTEFCAPDNKQADAGDGAGVLLWPLIVLLAIGAASFIAWAPWR